MLRSETFLLFIICLIDFCFLSYAISTISISYYEADAFYNSSKISAVLARLSVGIFGQNDYALRLPFVICHIFSVALLYKVSKQILKRKFDRVVSVIAFILLHNRACAFKYLSLSAAKDHCFLRAFMRATFC